MATPTRLIIVLAKTSSTLTYAMRADVPVGQEAAYAVPGATSPTGNVSDPDLPGMVAGTVSQSIQTVDIAQGTGETGAAFRTRVQTYLIGQQAAYQAQISAATPRNFFGAFYNGTTWSNSGG